MKKILLYFIAFILLVTGNISFAQTPVLQIKKSVLFSQPIDCVVEENCWIINYVDMIADDGEKTDPFCLSRTYDGHTGTDFALMDGAAMLRGVNVLAAADGTIKKIREGEPDQWRDQDGLEVIRSARKECGNAILIDHGAGVETLYCHLKNGSIKGKTGETVKRGQVIAQVGLSGLTEFPHLHFGILNNRLPVDPFTGVENTKNCNAKPNPLWEKTVSLSYQPISVQALGFVTTLPDFDEFDKNLPEVKEIAADTDQLLLWVSLLGVREGDQITLDIYDPSGKKFVTRDITQDKTRIRQYYYTGRKITEKPLQNGAWSGSVTVLRGDQKIHKSAAILIHSAPVQP